VGICKKIVKTVNKTELKPNVKRAWIDFCDKGEIGSKARLENEKLCLKDGISPFNLWTPVFYQTQTINSSTGARYHIDRLQFALLECEALTIHKSQGQTYTKVGVGIDSNPTGAMLYVAMSRVTELSGLYLLSKHKSSLLGKAYLNMPLRTRMEIAKLKRSKKVEYIEMQRMRKECQLENKFPFLLENTNNRFLTDDSIFIMFHNVRAFNTDKRVNVMNDFGFKKADIIMLVETHTNLNHVSHVALDGYELKLLTGCKGTNQSQGQITFSKKKHTADFSMICHNANEKAEATNCMLEMSMFQYKRNDDCIYICSVYKHPILKMSEFYKEFKEFLSESIHYSTNNNDYNPKLFVFGDFNIDFNVEKKYLNIFLNELGLHSTFENTSTHNSNNQIDWCFTNVNKTTINDKQRFESGVYESWFSDHKPIWLKINLY